MFATESLLINLEQIEYADIAATLEEREAAVEGWSCSI